MKLCPACSGTGFAPPSSQAVECPMCYGTGTVVGGPEEGTLLMFSDGLRIYTEGKWVVYEPPKIFKGMVF